MIRKLFVLSLLLGALSWLGACDDDSSSADAGPDTPTDTPTDTATDTPVDDSSVDGGDSGL